MLIFPRGHLPGPVGKDTRKLSVRSDGSSNPFLRRLRARRDAQLWVAGDGGDAYVQSLRDTVATHDLGDAVSFLGFVSGEEKQRVLREAWGFALPSHQEHVGVAVLEAGAAEGPSAVRAAFSGARVGEQLGTMYAQAVGARR